ncbi:hypothetical protein KUTeg_006118, partial [Tegillarca granosa]
MLSLTGAQRLTIYYVGDPTVAQETPPKGALLKRRDGRYQPVTKDATMADILAADTCESRHNREFLLIGDAKCTLEYPEVESFVFENGAKFWCYFCTEEIHKHQQLGTCTLKYGGLLDHIASKDHQQKTIRFFRDNRVDEKQHKTGDFILDSDQTNSFKEKAELCIRKFEQKQEEEIQKGAQNIYNTAIKSRYIHQSGYQQSLSEQKFSARTQGSSTNQKGRRFVRSTISAYGEGLTFIGVQHVDEEEGNVHTGGVPPWLRPDTDEGDTQKREIGPTVLDFKRHVEQEKKKKLPACRVGAKFDHKTPTSSQWLPSFGRVWNHGRRQQSKSFFEKQNKTQQIRSDFGWSKFDKDSESTVQSHVVPYKRRKMATEISGDSVSTKLHNGGDYYTSQTDLFTKTQNLSQHMEFSSSVSSHSIQQTINNSMFGNGYHDSLELSKTFNSTEQKIGYDETALSRYKSQSNAWHKEGQSYIQKDKNVKSEVCGGSGSEFQKIAIKPYIFIIYKIEFMIFIIYKIQFMIFIIYKIQFMIFIIYKIEFM